MLSPTSESSGLDERPKTAPGNRSTSRLGDLTISTNPLAALPKRMAPFTLSHRKNASSIDSSSIPTQTIMKALVSRPPPNSQLAINTIRSLRVGAAFRQEENAMSRARRFSEAISELNLEADPEGRSNRLSALNSPCFYHKRFEEAVDLDRVLEELLEDGWLSSHSRLMKTATGVREVSRQLQRKPIKRAVRNVMIVTKARDNDLVVLTRELAEWLMSTPRYESEVGVNVYVDEKLKCSKRFDADSLIASDPRFNSMLRYWTNEMCESSPEKFDLVLTLGGDGTVLFTSWLFQRIVPPVLSFSLGSLGFLTNFEYQNFKNSLNAIMGDAGMRVNLRMRFTCTVYRHGRAGSDTPVEAEQFEVLNEVSLPILRIYITCY
jgi:NAD+ kinase